MNGCQTVTLQGGPFDGDTRMVAPNWSEITIQYEVGVRLRDYGGPTRVPLLELATYRRSGPDVFTFCRTQAGPGDIGHRQFYQPEGGGVMSETGTETGTPVEPDVEETEEEETEEQEETETTEEPATTPATPEPEGELEF